MIIVLLSKNAVMKLLVLSLLLSISVTVSFSQARIGDPPITSMHLQRNDIFLNNYSLSRYPRISNSSKRIKYKRLRSSVDFYAFTSPLYAVEDTITRDIDKCDSSSLFNSGDTIIILRKRERAEKVPSKNKMDSQIHMNWLEKVLAKIA